MLVLLITFLVLLTFCVGPLRSPRRRAQLQEPGLQLPRIFAADRTGQGGRKTAHAVQRAVGIAARCERIAVRARLARRWTNLHKFREAARDRGPKKSLMTISCG